MFRPDLEAEQAPSGAFPCVIEWRRRSDACDENGFATALVLRRMRRLGIRFAAIERSLDFLETCAAEPSGAFSFWPRATRPAWAAGVPPDADDTAVITLELYAHGRRSRAQAQDTLVDVLIASLTGRPAWPGPVWRRAGVFPTWLDPGGADRANIVDCAVNANVLALMASLGERELPGFAGAVDMIVAAVDWCEQGGSGRAAKRADTIAPYYASPHAVVQILDDAVWCGATELAGSRDRLAALVGAAPEGQTAWWRNAYAGPVWHCRALQLLTEERRRAEVHAGLAEQPLRLADAAGHRAVGVGQPGALGVLSGEQQTSADRLAQQIGIGRAGPRRDMGIGPAGVGIGGP